MSVILLRKLNLKGLKNYSSLFFCPQNYLLDTFTQTSGESLTCKMLHFILWDVQWSNRKSIEL